MSAAFASDSNPASALWRDPAHGLMPRIGVLMGEHGWHVARCVVLVPYAQLMEEARTQWAQCGAAGFTPRFETTRNWARSAGGFVPAEHDLAFDMARDLVTAQSLLSRAGFGPERVALSGRLVELAMQLAPLAAAELPQERGAWIQRARVAADVGSPSDWFRTEQMLVSVAVAWAGTSAYATDVLLAPATRKRFDALIVLGGFQSDPLTRKLVDLWGDDAVVLPMPEASARTHAARQFVAEVQQGEDPEDEAELAAACVLRALQEGRAPVALVASDRALTRRISAQLVARGVSPHDETGWKLSTTRAAATTMSALRACSHDASSDQVLDWLKASPRFAAGTDAFTAQLLESRLRHEGQRDWLSWCGSIARSEREQDAALMTFTDTVEVLRSQLMRARPLGDWLPALRQVLQDSGQWEALAEDAAGADLIAALWLDASDIDFGATRLTLAEFTGWVRDVLEAASFAPESAEEEPQVVVLPLHQMLGRAFGAVVIPACDERRLPASPEPPGQWTAPQRAALGLASRELLEQAQRDAWAAALRTPSCTLTWRRVDEGGEPVRASPLMQALMLDGAALEADDPRPSREIELAPTHYPEPIGALLPVGSISSSAYEDLRRCPYRFFALRQLGLREADELDAEVDKRDFGNWLHEVLGHFHLALHESPTLDRPKRLQLLALAEAHATRKFGLSEAEFLPFAAAWPAVRDGYLAWLEDHEAAGNVFAQAEIAVEQPLGKLKLVGRLDRVDRLPDGRAFVLDYKTEPLATSRDRVKDPNEDTQLAFYAAMIDEDSLRAAYVNVGEKSSGTHTVEQRRIVDARDALVQGIQDDFARIERGVPLHPLGEGGVCDFCSARGLCRKDFWSDDAKPAIGALGIEGAMR